VFHHLWFVQMWPPQRSAAARCGGAVGFFPLPWVFAILVSRFVLHNPFGRGWRVVGLFDDGGAREEDEWMARRMVFWPGEAEGWEIAGCGDLIGD
jgi:hypothetical protein